MIYGANGYTGRLLAEEAIRRGHRPVLAGRSQQKLDVLGRELNLPVICVGLEDTQALANALDGMSAVLHAAGPFKYTSTPMLQACLLAKVSYLDITGEIGVFEKCFRYNDQAKQAGIAILPGVGFDVVPTDCLSAYVSAKIPAATQLEIAFTSLGQTSPGTTKSFLEGLPQGGWLRRNGKLVPYRIGKGAKWVRFTDKERYVLPIPWGDLSTAYRSTGISNITTYMAYPPSMVRSMQLGAPVLSTLLSIRPLRRLLQKVVEQRISGPDEAARQRGKSRIWARVTSDNGDTAQAWLETTEGYQFTALAGIRSIEKLFEQRPVGALTPSLAFGADFVLEIDDTRRFDSLNPIK